MTIDEYCGCGLVMVHIAGCGHLCMRWPHVYTSAPVSPHLPCSRGPSLPGAMWDECTPVCDVTISMMNWK